MDEPRFNPLENLNISYGQYVARELTKRWEVYYDEVKRVLEVHGVKEEVIYDAFHNATIKLSALVSRQEHDDGFR